MPEAELVNFLLTGVRGKVCKELGRTRQTTFDGSIWKSFAVKRLPWTKRDEQMVHWLFALLNVDVSPEMHC